MTTILMLAAVLPALFLVSRVYRTDRFEKEPVGLLLKLLGFGILSTFLAIALEYLGEWILDGFVSYWDPMYNVIYYFIIIAGAEEISKFLFLKLGSYKNSAFNCMFDGIVYAVTVALGFALIENIFYVLDGGLSTALVRAITAIPGHAADGVFMGIWYGRAKHMQSIGQHDAEKKNLFLAILIPAIIHGAYDFILFINPDSIIASLAVILFFILFVIVLFTITIIKTRKIAKTDFYIDGLSGKENSAQKRAELAKKLNLPCDMTANALLAALKILVTYEEYLTLVGRKTEK